MCAINLKHVRLQCYVVGTGNSGCFVIFDGGVSGRVLLKQLSDRFVYDPAQEFPAGKLVAGKILSKVSVSMRFGCRKRCV